MAKGRKLANHCEEKLSLETLSFLNIDRVNLRNSGCLLNTRNWLQSGPSLCSEVKGRKVPYQYVMELMAAKLPFSV